MEKINCDGTVVIRRVTDSQVGDSLYRLQRRSLLATVKKDVVSVNGTYAKDPAARLRPGRPYPLGATLTDTGTNFAIYSEHATKMLLCLFDGPDGSGERTYALNQRTGHIWHGFHPAVRAGQRYGYRAEGRYDPWSGDWFNPAKLLIDPYADTIVGDLVWNDGVFAFERSVSDDFGTANWAESAPMVPRSVVVDHSFDWEDDRSPDVDRADTVIYETHVKGITALHPEIDETLRGTYAGLAQPQVIAHLKSLGVTTVELLPVQRFIDEEFLVDAGLRNYWGYNPVGLAAPETRYATEVESSSAVGELKSLVKAMHSNGLEVVLDVVFNHSGEGGRTGPTLSMRGIDNRTYYRLKPDDLSQYLNYSGTGNTLNLEHPAVMRLVLDSLRRWAVEYRVDGFRFDLATSLGREHGGFSAASRLFAAIYQDPVLCTKKLIAEPWDIGPAGYQLGHFPAEWSEWNDRFRDTVRSFWLGHPRSLGEFAVRMSGSADLFDRPDRGPCASLNFVTCHDGFTLSDLVSHTEKHNEANNELNDDGHNHNLSANFGVEGETRDAAIERRRARARRNLFATAMLAYGMPMMLGGDELGSSQGGNNNAYPQDNELTWYDWSASRSSDDFVTFVRTVLAIRRRYSCLRPRAFPVARIPTDDAPHETLWAMADGREINVHDWSHEWPRAVLWLVPSDVRDQSRSGKTRVLIVFNPGANVAEVELPSLSAGDDASGWHVVLDTAATNGRKHRRLNSHTVFEVAAETMLVLATDPLELVDGNGEDAI